MSRLQQGLSKLNSINGPGSRVSTMGGGSAGGSKNYEELKKQIHARLVELDPVALSGELEQDRYLIAIGHEMLRPRDRKRPVGDLHHLAQHAPDGGEAAMRAGKLVSARLIPDNIRRKDRRQCCLITGLGGFDIGFGNIDVRHVTSFQKGRRCALAQRFGIVLKKLNRSS